MEVGDLVKLSIHSKFTSGIVNGVGIPFNTIGIIIQKKCNVCSVFFPSLDGEIRSLFDEDLEIVSEGE
jgi:hypothetical protein